MQSFSRPNRPLACGYLGAPSLAPSIFPPAGRAARPPLIWLGRFWPPFLRPYKLMPPGCHLPSPPGAEGVLPLPCVNRARSPRQARRHVGMQSFSRPNRPLACGDLGVLSLDPPSSCSPARLLAPPPARSEDLGSLLRLYKLMPSGCHLPSLPGAEGAKAHSCI